MKISLEWLTDYIDLDGIGVEAIAHALTMVGFEVEGIETAGLPPLEHVVVGEIRSHKPHPDADRLSVCQVDVGDGTERTIVCGARNFRDGDRVIVALPGAVLPGDFKIKKSKLRGVVSEGMMCSERELGIGEDHAGIAILDARPKLATPVNDLYPKPDTVFDIEITPNRPDALSHLGIARELSAWFKRPLGYPELRLNPSASEPGSLVDSLECMEPDRCPHYRGYSVRGVAVSESPAWLQRRLRAIGLRPINNVVDATNFILHETGQPLHAFDVAKIRGPRIIIRRAHAGETLVTLDDKPRRLETDDLVIADAERALVVAGVMGSVDAEVDSGSTDLLLESAWFHPGSVRRTSRGLGLSTDSSYRFERGVDPKGADYAALRCLDLILELAGGQLMGPPLVAGEPPLVKREISVSPGWIRERLGFPVSDEAIQDSLSRLELRVDETADAEGEPLLRVGIPSFRQDLYRPIDLVEEVIRIYGSDRVPESAVRATVTLREDDPVPVYQRKATDVLVGRGFHEVLHYTLREASESAVWAPGTDPDMLALANPLASDASHLRCSLLPGLLDCLRLNRSRHNTPSRYFECGRIFHRLGERLHELFSVAFVVPQDAGTGWREGPPADYYEAAALVRDLFSAAGLRPCNADFQALSGDPAWQEGHAACSGNLVDGYAAQCGILNLALTRQHDLDNPVMAGSVVFSPEFLQKPAVRAAFQPFSLYPPALRDVALVAPLNQPAGEVEERVREAAQRHAGSAFALESVSLFDLYEGTGLPEGTRSLAFQMVFRHPDRTLTDEEVNAAFQRVQADLDALPGLSVRK